MWKWPKPHEDPRQLGLLPTYEWVDTQEVTTTTAEKINRLSQPLNKLESTYTTESGKVREFFLTNGKVLDATENSTSYVAFAEVDFDTGRKCVGIYFSINHQSQTITYEGSYFWSEKRNNVWFGWYQMDEIISEITGMKIWERLLIQTDTKKPWEEIIINNTTYHLKKISSNGERAIIDLWFYTISFNPRLARLGLKVSENGRSKNPWPSLQKEFSILARYIVKNREKLWLKRYKAFNY